MDLKTFFKVTEEPGTLILCKTDLLWPNKWELGDEKGCVKEREKANERERERERKGSREIDYYFEKGFLWVAKICRKSEFASKVSKNEHFSFISTLESFLNGPIPASFSYIFVLFSLQ